MNWLNELSKLGIPISENDLKNYFQDLAKKEGLEVVNMSDYSPFWRLQKSTAIEPVKDLVDFLAKKVMPGLYVSTAVGDALEQQAWVYKLKRFDASKARGKLIFTRLPGNVNDTEILAGTIIRSANLNNKFFKLIVVETKTLFNEENEVEVLVEAENVGSDYNIGAGYFSIIEGDLSGVRVSNNSDWLIEPGKNMETDESLRLRIRNAFSAIANWHTDAKYRAMISSVLGISPDLIYITKENPRGAGSADAWIIFETFQPSSDFLAKINKYISEGGNHGHGDDFVCKAVPGKNVNLVMNYWGMADKTEVENFVKCAFRENSEYDEKVSKTFAYAVFSMSKLDQELHNQFPNISRIVFSVGDIITEREVARLINLTVVQNNG